MTNEDKAVLLPRIAAVRTEFIKYSIDAVVERDAAKARHHRSGTVSGKIGRLFKRDKASDPAAGPSPRVGRKMSSATAASGAAAAAASKVAAAAVDPAGARQGRAHTSGWIVVREGYLLKTKRVSNSLHKSTKLRYFVSVVYLYSRQHVMHRFAVAALFANTDPLSAILDIEARSRYP